MIEKPNDVTVDLERVRAYLDARSEPGEGGCILATGLAPATVLNIQSPKKRGATDG